MSDLNEIMDRFFRLIVQADAVEEFVALCRARAETTARNYVATPTENRDFAMGQIANFYELADGAQSALAASETKAKVEEADRIRKELLENDE